MKYRIICDFSENFGTKTEEGHINDHQTKDTFDNILLSMSRLGYDCDIFGGVPELIKAYHSKEKFNPDTIFINLSDGTDKRYSRVQIPILCDLLNVKYSGGGPFEVALTSNKYYSSLALKAKNFLVPKNILVTKTGDIEKPCEKVIVKPNSEGSSIGITDQSVCTDTHLMNKQIQNLLNQFSEVVIEEYIPGYDVTCFVVGNEKIVLNEVLVIAHHNKFVFTKEVMSYKDHLLGTRIFYPCKGILTKLTENKVKQISINIKNELNINDFCRIDYRVTTDNKIYFLEINTVPAINMNSQVGVICNNLGISFDEFIDKIVKTITERLNHE